jgi:serine/threonine protein kinase
LAGYTLIRHLGGGGFADVFLYHQKNLDRDVAVKVLLAADSSADTRRRFEAEGQVMARLSEEHQNIVPVYDAAICSDGRPYLVMQYCPRDDLSKRYKASPLPVAEVLSIGVQLAGAVESAHRQGILHRDIKPANVLTKRSGRPALADFGISVTMAAAEDPESVGVSIPWSPPELLADNPVGDVRSDVYSLTATLYTLLAGRSPFELPGRPNDLVDLLSRIPRVPLTMTGNVQTPRSLERVLARGLAKDPSLRYPSALVLARELQAVETELSGSVTNFEFLDENPTAALAEIPGEQADHTRIRPIVIRAQSDRLNTTDATDLTGIRGGAHDPASTGPVTGQDRPPPATGPISASADNIDHTQLRGKGATGGYLDPQYLSDPTPADTFVPVRSDRVAPPTADPIKKSRIPAVIAGVVGLLVAGVLAWIVISQGTQAPTVATDTTSLTPTALAFEAVVPAPGAVTAEPSPDGLIFAWTNPDPQPGDSYDWWLGEADSDGPATIRVQAPPVVIPEAVISAAQPPCFNVIIIRDNGTYSARPANKCLGQG